MAALAWAGGVFGPGGLRRERGQLNPTRELLQRLWSDDASQTAEEVSVEGVVRLIEPVADRPREHARQRQKRTRRHRHQAPEHSQGCGVVAALAASEQAADERDRGQHGLVGRTRTRQLPGPDGAGLGLGPPDPEVYVQHREIELDPGELYVVPRGVEHRPRADPEAHVLLIEPRGTPNTGDAAATPAPEVEI